MTIGLILISPHNFDATTIEEDYWYKTNCRVAVFLEKTAFFEGTIYLLFSTTSSVKPVGQNL